MSAPGEEERTADCPASPSLGRPSRIAIARPTGAPGVPPVRAPEHTNSVDPDRAARAQRGLEAPQRVAHRGGRLVVEAPLERGGRGRFDAGAQVAQLVE